MPWRAELVKVRASLEATRRALRIARSERDVAREQLAVRQAEHAATLHRLQADRDATLEGIRAERDSAIERVRAERDVVVAKALGEKDTAVAEAEALRSKDRERAELVASLDDRLSGLTKQLQDLRALHVTTDRRVRFLHRELMTDIQALNQLMGRYSPQARLPPVAGWALSPAGLLALVDVIETRDARNILECGSGTSTLWIGYALQALGRGKLTSLEHSSEFAEKTSAVVAAHGLSDYVDVQLAPLAPLKTSRGEFSWYSVDSTRLPDSIDVLLVDGPPGTTGRHARYPALPVLIDRLGPRAVIIADDIDRRDETEMLKYWLEDDPRLIRVESPGAGIEMLEVKE